MEDSFSRLVYKALSDQTETRVKYAPNGNYIWYFEPQELKDLRGKIQVSKHMSEYYTEARLYYRSAVEYEKLQNLYVEYYNAVEAWLKETVH